MDDTVGDTGLQQEFPRIKAEAHRIKGTAGTLSMVEVVEVRRTAAAIEFAAAGGRIDPADLVRLRREIAETRYELKAAGFMP